MLSALHSIPGQSETTTVSLATLSTNALQLFADLTIIAADNIDADDTSADLSIEQQHERLVLWASNLGATHLGHSSLDYRLRQADLVRNAIGVFLNDLCQSLLECREFLLYGDLSVMDDVDAYAQMERTYNYADEAVAAGQQSMLEADYGSESGGFQEHEFSLILESIAETINCLYKIATRIRNPATRILTKKVLEFAMIDRETGVDLAEEYALLDREHLREVFRDYRSADAPSSLEEEVVSAQALDSTREEPLDFLAQRLAQANTIRRKQFAYWSRHRKKLDAAPEATAQATGVRQPRPQQASHSAHSAHSAVTIARSVYVANSVVPSLPTTATTLDPAQIDVEDTKSAVSVSDYAGSIRSASSTRRVISELPEPPSKLRGQRYFECPYCLTLCSGAYLERKAWRSHLLRDLRPYVCTYRDCPEAKCLFDTRHEWVAHEDSCHRRIWRCLEHPESTFPTIAAYKHHIRDLHVSNRIELESAELLRVGESAPELADRPCPICFADISDATALQQHVAAHLIRIALFSLPRSTDADGDMDSGTSWSGRANGYHSDSSQIASSESSSSSAQSNDDDMGSPKTGKRANGSALSQNALRHLEAAMLDQGSNAKVEQFLSHLTQSDLENKSSDGDISSTRKPSRMPDDLEADQQDDQVPYVRPKDIYQPRSFQGPETPHEPDNVSHCQHCGEIIQTGTGIELASKTWHFECFECSTCHKPLDSSANLLLLGDGSLVCDDCTYQCSACGKKIEDLAILAGDQAYCAACFRCRNCKRKIENLRYANTSQGKFCMDCHEALMARRREKARLNRQRHLGDNITIGQPSASKSANTDSSGQQDSTTADEEKASPDLSQPHPPSPPPTVDTQRPSISAPIAGPPTAADEQESIVSPDSSSSAEAPKPSGPSVNVVSTEPRNFAAGVIKHPSGGSPTERMTKGSVSSMFRGLFPRKK